MATLADVFREINRMRDDGVVADYAIGGATVRILLALQRDELPLIARHRPLRPWERPWNIDP